MMNIWDYLKNVGVADVSPNSPWSGVYNLFDDSEDEQFDSLIWNTPDPRAASGEQGPLNQDGTYTTTAQAAGNPMAKFGSGVQAASDAHRAEGQQSLANLQAKIQGGMGQTGAGQQQMCSILDPQCNQLYNNFRR